MPRSKPRGEADIAMNELKLTFGLLTGRNDKSHHTKSQRIAEIA